MLAYQLGTILLCVCVCVLSQIRPCFDPRTGYTIKACTQLFNFKLLFGICGKRMRGMPGGLSESESARLNKSLVQGLSPRKKCAKSVREMQAILRLFVSTHFGVQSNRLQSDLLFSD
jgi:hypothetical protein